MLSKILLFVCLIFSQKVFANEPKRETKVYFSLKNLHIDEEGFFLKKENKTKKIKTISKDDQGFFYSEKNSPRVKAWACGNCNALNLHGVNKCQSCDERKYAWVFMPKDAWMCDACDALNTMDRRYCSECDYPIFND